MKLKIVCLALLITVIQTGCIKIIASDENLMLPEDFHDRRFGTSAKDFLSDEQYTSLRVEIQYMPGFAPDEKAFTNLHQFLYTHLNKPEGITIRTKEITAVPNKTLAKEGIISIERKNRFAYTSGKQLALYILYTNGEFTDSKILGAAYRNTSAVIFGKAIKKNSNKIGKPDRTKLETTVLLHEMGHLLGLVNEGSLMEKDHSDHNKASHCKNKKCLMYYGIEIENRFGVLLKKDIPTLDDDCLADLRRAGGK